MGCARIVLIKCGGAGEDIASTLITLLQQESSFDLRAVEYPLTAANDDTGVAAMGGAISNEYPDVVIFCGGSDLQEGTKLVLELAQQGSTALPVIIACQPSDPSEAFHLLNKGATDVICPPFKAVELFPWIWCLLTPAGSEPTPTLRSNLKERLGLKEFVGQSPELMRVIKKIPLLAQADSTVLISGEPGTGKEICARSIHYHSERTRRPRIVVTCGAVSSDLDEEELFGHQKGATVTTRSAGCECLSRTGIVRMQEQAKRRIR